VDKIDFLCDLEAFLFDFILPNGFEEPVVLVIIFKDAQGLLVLPGLLGDGKIVNLIHG
jgi:hypothetical protein